MKKENVLILNNGVLLDKIKDNFELIDVNPNWYTSNKRQFVKLKIKGEL